MDPCSLSQNTAVYIDRFRSIYKTMVDSMRCVELTENISTSFIEQMIPHHRAAIEMSENLLQYTTNIPLQNIAENIISSQRKSIENMMAVYPSCQSCVNTAQELACYRQANTAILDTMFCGMESACVSNNINGNFMREMIPHHLGAVRMSENALHNCLCPGLVPLLDAIIDSQKKGIRQMQQLLRCLVCP